MVLSIQGGNIPIVYDAQVGEVGQRYRIGNGSGTSVTNSVNGGNGMHRSKSLESPQPACRKILCWADVAITHRFLIPPN